MKSHRTTAQEAQQAFAAKLERDPEFARRLAEREQERARASSEIAEESKALLQELAAVGHPVASVWDLSDYREDHPAAVPVLVRHLRIPYRGRIREGIGRALVGPSARPYFRTLVDAFVDVPDQDLRRGLAVSLAYLGTPGDFPVLEALVRNRLFGPERKFLLHYFERSRTPAADTLLSDLLDDPELATLTRLAITKRNKKIRKAAR